LITTVCQQNRMPISFYWLNWLILSVCLRGAHVGLQI
jgi:hypothetical protein